MEATQTARWRSPDQNEPSARANFGAVSVEAVWEWGRFDQLP